MSRTIYLQPIFVPDEKRFKRNLDSLNSFIIYCKKWNVNINCLFGGWGKKEYMDQIIKLLQDKSLPFNVVNISRFEKNYGKATVVNHLVEKADDKGLEYDFILTADSDILFKPDVPNMVERLENCAKELEEYRKIPFGIITFNQEGDNRHWKKVYENELNTKSENFVYGNTHEGYAGGCIFVNRKAWDRVGGYRVMGVYAGDDGWLMLDLYNQGFSLNLILSLSIIHPEENDDDYKLLKDRVLQRDSRGGKIKNNINNIIEEFDEFWLKTKEFE